MDDDLDTLLKIARTEITSGLEELEYNDPTIMEVTKFINAKNLKAGSSSVPMAIIYDTYCQFSKTPLTRKRFTKVFSKFIKTKKALGQPVADIDPTALALPLGYTIYKDPRYGFKRAKELKPSRFIGVYPDPAGGWAARLPTETGHRLIGHFWKEEEAARAYDKAAKLALGENAMLNFYEKEKKD